MDWFRLEHRWNLEALKDRVILVYVTQQDSPTTLYLEIEPRTYGLDYENSTVTPNLLLLLLIIIHSVVTSFKF